MGKKRKVELGYVELGLTNGHRARFLMNEPHGLRGTIPVQLWNEDRDGRISNFCHTNIELYLSMFEAIANGMTEAEWLAMVKKRKLVAEDAK